MLPSKLKNFIDSPENNFLITGPPGSGKSRMLVSLLEHLITEKDYSPWQILVFSFNRKWAKILRDMISERVKISLPEIQITSIFAFCADFIQKTGPGQEGIKVLNASAQWRMLKDLVTLGLERSKYPLTFKYFKNSPHILNSFIQEVFDFILRAQENLIDPEMMLNKFTPYTNPFYQELAGIYSNYTSQLEKQGLYNYGRLLADTVKILKNDAAIRDAARKQYSFLIVDELQEVNRAQFEIIECIKDRKCVYFGNDDECIYAFRGSMSGSFSRVYDFLNNGSNNSENILKLTANHRNSHVIDYLCTEFIRLNKHPDKKGSTGTVLSVHKDRQDTVICPEIREFKSTIEELNFISHRIKQMVFTRKIRPESICIIIKGQGYKTGLLESLLKQDGLSFTRRGSRTVLDNAYVKYIVNFARLAELLNSENEGDPLSEKNRQVAINKLLVLLLSSEFSGISPAYIKNLSCRGPADLWCRINNFSQSEAETGQDSIQSFIDTVNKFRKFKNISAFDFIYKFFCEGSAGLTDYIFNKKNLNLPERERALNIIGDFLKSVQDYVSDNPEKHTLSDYLTFLDSIIDSGFIEEVEESIKDFIIPGSINIMSYHQAKGLEFDAVFLPFINRDYLPAAYSKSQLYDLQLFNLIVGEKVLPQDSLQKIHMEDERKLFYTGMSRAKKYLAVTSCFMDEKSAFFEAALKINDKIKKFLPCKKEAYDDNLPDLKRKWLARKRTAVAVSRLNSGRFIDQDSFRKNVIFLKIYYPPSEWWVNICPTVNRRNPFKKVVQSYSYTSLSEYRDCPMRYKFSFYFRIKEPENMSVLLGGIYHKILRKYFEHGSKDLSLELLEKIVTETVNENEFEFVNLKEEVVKRALDPFQDYFERYVAGKKFDSIMEKDFSFNIGRDRIRGRIDQINLLDDGRAEIVDFKSGKKSAANTPDNDLQLPLYRIAVNMCSDLDFLKGRELKLEYIFLGDEKVKNMAFPVENYDFKKFEAGIKKTISSIKRERFEPDPSTSFICSTCQFRIACAFNTSG